MKFDIRPSSFTEALSILKFSGELRKTTAFKLSKHSVSRFSCTGSQYWGKKMFHAWAAKEKTFSRITQHTAVLFPCNPSPTVSKTGSHNSRLAERSVRTKSRTGSPHGRGCKNLFSSAVGGKKKAPREK